MSDKDSTWKKYRKRPVVIEARVATQDEIVRTLEGSLLASKGDYIIRGIHGEEYPCKSNIFKKTYDLIGEK